MPATDDIIETKMTFQCQGVQFSNTLYWAIQDLGGNPTISDAVLSIAYQYYGAFQTLCSIDCWLTCVLFRNISNPSEASRPVYANFIGLDAVSPPHPTNQVIRVARYAIRSPDSEVVVSSLAISGITCIHSKRGRLADEGELGTLEQFLKEGQVAPAGGWQIDPVIKVKDTAIVSPPTYQYPNVQACITHPVFKKLQSRNSVLCGTS